MIFFKPETLNLVFSSITKDCNKLQFNPHREKNIFAKKTYWFRTCIQTVHFSNKYSIFPYWTELFHASKNKRHVHGPVESEKLRKVFKVLSEVSAHLAHSFCNAYEWYWFRTFEEKLERNKWNADKCCSDLTGKVYYINLQVVRLWNQPVNINNHLTRLLQIFSLFVLLRNCFF